MNPSKPVLLKTVLLIGVLFVASACAFGLIRTVPNIGDGGLLSDEPCGPPCFFDITPGVTTRDELTQIIKENPVFESCQFFDNSDKRGLRGYQCINMGISLEGGEDLVSAIRYRILPGISMEEVIETLGPPDGVVVHAIPLPDYVYHSQLTLYYNTGRIALIFPEQATSWYEIKADAIVDDVAYYDELYYDEMVPFFSDWYGFRKYVPFYQ